MCLGVSLLLSAHRPGTRLRCESWQVYGWREHFVDKNLFFQFIYSVLYKTESIRQTGTLRYSERDMAGTMSHQRELQIHMKAVNNSQVLAVHKLYQPLWEFWEWMMWPLNHQFTRPPKNSLHRSKQIKKTFLDVMVGQFVSQYVLTDPAQEILHQQQEAQKHRQQMEAI